jgi:hypothetical protein
MLHAAVGTQPVEPAHHGLAGLAIDVHGACEKVARRIAFAVVEANLGMIHGNAGQVLQRARGEIVACEGIAQGHHDGRAAARRDRAQRGGKPVRLGLLGLQRQPPQRAGRRVDPVQGLRVGIPAGALAQLVFRRPDSGDLHGHRPSV